VLVENVKKLVKFFSLSCYPSPPPENSEFGETIDQCWGDNRVCKSFVTDEERRIYMNMEDDSRLRKMIESVVIVMSMTSKAVVVSDNYSKLQVHYGIARSCANLYSVEKRYISRLSIPLHGFALRAMSVTANSESCGPGPRAECFNKRMSELFAAHHK
jgi:hypothetical protein